MPRMTGEIDARIEGHHGRHGGADCGHAGRSVRYLVYLVKPIYFSVTYCKPGGCRSRQIVQLASGAFAARSDRIRDSGIPRPVSREAGPGSLVTLKPRCSNDL